MSSEELATWDQDHLYEGWGEDCSGSIALSSDSPIACNEDVTTPLSYYLDKIDYGKDDWDEHDEFVEQFFPDGVPEFTVEMPSEDNDSYYRIFVDGEQVSTKFAYHDGEINPHEEGRAEVEKELNS